MPDNVFLEFYKTTLDYKTKVISIIFASGIAIAIPNLVTFLNDRSKAEIDKQKAEIERQRVEKEIQLKQIELEITKSTKHQDHIAKFIELAASQDIELRLRFAEYFSFVAEEKDRKQWALFHSEIEKRRNATRDKIDELRDELAKERGKRDADEVRIALFERHLSWTEAELSPVRTNESVTVARRPEEPGVSANLTFFEAGMAITVDGWPEGRSLDPAWQPMTSLLQPGTNEPLDASLIPYITLPIRSYQTFGIALGDFAAVYNSTNKKLAFAIFGDIGPSRRLGEGSLALATNLGIPTNRLSFVPATGIVYIVFPGSRKQGERITRELIEEEGKKLFEKWGGQAELQRRRLSRG